MNVNTILEHLNHSHSPFHAVKECKEALLAKGFIELSDSEPFYLEEGKNYFVTRNQTSLIAFKIPMYDSNALLQFKVASAHSDSPTFKLKPNPDLNGNALRFNVEPYGGMIMSTWLDRPLSIAGRVLVRTKNGVESRILDINRDLLIIPNVAIHMNRDINRGYVFNPAVDMIPLAGIPSSYEGFLSFLEEELDDKTVEEVLSHDLYLYVRESTRVLGLENDLLSSPRLDDLSSAYCILEGFLEAKNSGSIDVFALFDNEEVGSLTRQGANSTFLRDTLVRVSREVFPEESSFETASISGVNLSVDNAHANHPNHPELSDKTTDVRLNGGIVLKYNAAQKYTTDGYSAALVKTIASLADVKVQEYTNRSDLPGGSTLGNISNSEVSFVSADIGLPQLAMHSAVELCGLKDIDAMARFIKVYYESRLNRNDEGFSVKPAR